MRAWIMLGRQRGSWKLCSQNDFETSKPTSIPTRSMSSNGPMRKPPPMRTMRSIVAWSATPSREQLERLQAERARAAVGEEAGAVARDDHRLPIRSPTARAVASASSRGLDAGDDLEQLHQRRAG